MKQFPGSLGTVLNHMSSKAMDHPIKTKVIRDVQEPAHHTDVMTTTKELKIMTGDVIRVVDKQHQEGDSMIALAKVVSKALDIDHIQEGNITMVNSNDKKV